MRSARVPSLLALLGGVAASSSLDAQLLGRFQSLEQELAGLEAAEAERGEELLKRVQSLEADHLERRLSDANATNNGTNTTLPVELAGAVDHTWLILCGALIMFMQAGFAMVEAGSCRARSAPHLLLKNLVDLCIGTIAFWAIGWTLAYGFHYSEKDMFAGTLEYFGHDFVEANGDGLQTPNPGNKMLNWFFQWTFCTTAATIVSGGVAERMTLPAYALFSLALTAGIYPVVVAWTWSGKGWLSAGDGFGVGFLDFAGSGIVHLTGGTGALVGAIMVGPRQGRFDPGVEDPWWNPGFVDAEYAAHSMPLVAFGTLILWFGWYGFNCGSTGAMDSTAKGQLAAHIAMTTTLSASTGGLVVLLIRRCIAKRYDISGMCGGILAGLVSITAGCSNVESGSAILIGAIGAVIYQFFSSLLKSLQVDDPVDAFAVHGAAGAWGVLAAALFDWGKGFDYYNGAASFTCLSNADGSCMSGAWAKGFAANVVEVIVIPLWVGVLSAVLLLPLRLAGLLRMPEAKPRTIIDAVINPTSRIYDWDEARQQRMSRVSTASMTY